MEQHQIESDAALFRRIRHWQEFRTTAEHLFPSDSALRWFMRKHEQALLLAGVLLKLPRGNYVDPEPFQAVAINLMRDRDAAMRLPPHVEAARAGR